MSIVDQSEIDALLAEAGELAGTADPELLLSPEPPRPTPPSPRPMRRSLPSNPELARILQLRVPVIVQLARRLMSIAQVRALSVGAIIEFEKNVESELDLLVNERHIGRGVCVKAGENFGLRITQVSDEYERIRSLGPKG